MYMRLHVCLEVGAEVVIRLEHRAWCRFVLRQGGGLVCTVVDWDLEPSVSAGEDGAQREEEKREKAQDGKHEPIFKRLMRFESRSLLSCVSCFLLPNVLRGYICAVLVLLVVLPLEGGP